MTVSPQDQLAATNRLRRALLAFQSAQVLVLTHQRQSKAPSQRRWRRSGTAWRRWSRPSRRFPRLG